MKLGTRISIALAIMAATIGCGDRRPRPTDGGTVDASRVDGGAFDGGGDSGADDAGPDLDAGADDASIDLDAFVPLDAFVSLDGGRDAGAGADAGRDGGPIGADAGRDGGPIGADAGLSPGDRIALVRATTGTLTTPIRIDGVMVTYVRTTGTSTGDPAGFFVQEAVLGPALFVAVDPAALTPAPARGDFVRFDVGATEVLNGQHRVTEISAFTVTSTGGDPALLVQNVSAADVPAAIGDYESELVRVDATIAGAFASCSTGYQCAQITTTGHPTASATYRFRAPDPVVATHGLRAGCTLRIGPTPLWRRDQSASSLQAQPSAWAASEVSMVSCPAPIVVRAIALDATTVAVTFDATLAPASVTAGAFTVTGGGGATVSAATASGSTATLTTSTLAPGITYTVTVASSVTDASGTGVSAAMNSATFVRSGTCPPATHLVISEIDYDMPASMDPDALEFVEIHNPTSAPVSLAGLAVVFFNGSGAAGTEYDRVALSGTIAAGGFVVVGPTGLSVPGGVTLFTFAGATQTNRIQNGAPDGVALLDLGPSTPVIVDALAYEGTMPTFTLTDGTALVSTESTTLADAASPGALARAGTSCDRDTPMLDFALAPAPSPGAPNP